MTEKTNKKDRAVTGFIIVVVALLIGFNLFSYFGASLMLPGKPLPFVSGIDPENGRLNTINLSEGTYLINFWATWCGACVSEIGELNRISQKVTLYGVMKKPFKKEIFDAVTPEFSNVISEEDFFNDNYISVIPTTVLVKDGVIMRVHTGQITAKIVDEWISKDNE